MKPRRVPLIIVGIVCFSAIIAAGWVVFSPPPSLDVARFKDLRSAGRYEAAAKLLESHLERLPGDEHAHLLLAQLLLERPDPAPDDAAEVERASQAIAHLESVRASQLRGMDAALVELLRGKALFTLGDWDGSETALARALKLDPLVPEAGWGLLNQYYLEGRAKDAQALALRMHAIEPDRRDRVQFLLELIRQDAQPPDPASLVEVLAPIVAERPKQVRTTLTYGLALVRSSQIDAGLDVLKNFVEANPESVEGWATLLGALDDASRPEVYAQTFAQLPPALANDPRFTRHRARVAQERQDWPSAVASYREAIIQDPLESTLLYRLGLSLRSAGQEQEAEQILDRFSRYKSGMEDVRALYTEANNQRSLGYVVDVDLYKRLGDLRERMLRPAEARAWYSLAMEASPEDREAASAIERLATAEHEGPL
jgi:tetratricopeptide (TPR) repeat protein